MSNDLDSNPVSEAARFDKKLRRFRVLLDNVHHYWHKGSSATHGFIGRGLTYLGVGLNCFVHLTENIEHPQEWLKSMGYTAIENNETSGFLLSLFTELEPTSEVIKFISCYDSGEPLEIRQISLGEDASVCTIETIHIDGSRSVWGDVYAKTTMAVLAEQVRAWFWSLMGPSVIVQKELVRGRWKAGIHKLGLTTGDYIGPHDDAYMHKYWQAFQEKSISRCLLFIGPPGTGKSTMARRLALNHNKTLLHIGASVLGIVWGSSMMGAAFEMLQPGVLLLDDIHGIPQDDIAEALYLMEFINNKASINTLVIGTANQIAGIDQALRRPGRFDVAFEFDPPRTQAWREEILLLYAREYDCVHRVTELLPLIEQHAVGLTPAYLKELVKTICALSEFPDLTEVLAKQCETMKALYSSRVDEDELMRAGEFSMKLKKQSVGFGRLGEAIPNRARPGGIKVHPS